MPFSTRDSQSISTVCWPVALGAYNLDGGPYSAVLTFDAQLWRGVRLGVELTIAHCLDILASIVPDADARRANNGCYDTNQFSKLEVVSKSIPLALHNRTDYEGLPVLIQITTFECGGISRQYKIIANLGSKD
jgi:hypothetical protein